MKRMATLVGHGGDVRALSVSADGRWVSSGNSDGTVWIGSWTRWAGGDADGPRQLDHLGRDGSGRLVAASADASGVVRVWEKPSGLSVPVFEFADRGWSNLPLVSISPDGQLLAVREHARVHLWDHATRQAVAVLTSDTRNVEALAISPDSAWLATVDEGHVIRVWSVHTHQCVAATRTDGNLAAVNWNSEIIVVGIHGLYGYRFTNWRPSHAPSETTRCSKADA